MRGRASLAMSAVLVASVACGVGCSSSSRDTVTAKTSHIVDLGHALAASDPSWDGTPGLTRTPAATYDKDGFAASVFTVDEHFGTHVDAPAHFVPGGTTVDRIAADRFVRPAVCIDVRARAAGHEDYQVTAADITEFEHAHGPIAADTVVLIATGWEAHWSEPGRYMNMRDGVRHFPGLSVEAARLLVDRKVAGIGIDTPSVDYGPSTTFDVHHVTMPTGIYHIENVTGLAALPPKGFTVVVAPVKIAGGSGAPARVFAYLP